MITVTGEGMSSVYAEPQRGEGEASPVQRRRMRHEICSCRCGAAGMTTETGEGTMVMVTFVIPGRPFDSLRSLRAGYDGEESPAMVGKYEGDPSRSAALGMTEPWIATS